jgi:hypothetical protein
MTRNQISDCTVLLQWIFHKVLGLKDLIFKYRMCLNRISKTGNFEEKKFMKLEY